MMCKDAQKNGKREQVTNNNSNNLLKCNNQKSLQPFNSIERHKKLPSICILSNCYKIVQQAAKKLDLIEVGPKKHWNLLWTDATLTVQQCRDLKRYQMVNYFPGIGEIARKDLLARNLARMQKHFPEDYDFFPKTWWLPADLGDLIIHARSRRGETYIVKPGCGSQGRGILITKNISELESVQQSICQIYIPRPLLIDGFKFDIRIYTVITSCDPLRIYVYNEGIVRFATHKYAEPMTENINNVFMHLTNYAINKNHCGFIQGEDGSKRRISVLNSWLAEQEIDASQLWNQIDCDIVKTIITSSAALKHQYHLCFPKHPQACFILLGFDVLLDVDLKPYIIEVNRCPSLNIDSVIDEEVKEQLLIDIFNLLNLKRLDQHRVQGEERRRVYQRTQRTIDRLARRFEVSQSEDLHTSVTDSIQCQISWEEAHMGNFRKVYPVEDGAKYDNFFIEASNTLYQETAASRARREYSQLQRNDAGFDEDICIETVCEENEEGTSDDESCNKASTNKKMIRGRIPILNSFLPQYISTAEERDRLRGLDKREGLLRTLNLKAHLINALRLNGDFRSEEEEILEQPKSPCIVPSVSPGTASLQVRATAPPLWPRKELLPPLERQNISLFNNGTLYTSLIKRKSLLPYQNESYNELKVVCNEVPMAIRPLPSRVSRWASLNQNLTLVSHKSQANCKIVCSSSYN